MRLICTLNDQKKARALSECLKREGIENVCETTANTDWGSHDYGTLTCTVWVIDEDQYEAAVGWVNELEKDPNQPAFAQKLTPPLSDSKENPLKQIRLAKPRPLPEKKAMGVITLYTLIACCILLLISEMTAPAYIQPPPGLPYAPIYSAQIKKDLMYDYPQAYEILDRLISAYGAENLANPTNLPPEGQVLLAQFYHTPYWHGFYDLLVYHFQHPGVPFTIDSPMFEKLQQGEVWRLFTPCLLHSDLFHLFFNMIWLVVLGRQIEERIGKRRYLLLILFTGIGSNTIQYLSSGSNFIGFSGVLCAMLTFIWARQKKAAWEGYQLLPATMAFMMLFIFTMFSIQLISFVMESAGMNSISPGIANAAHLSGAALGWIVGRWEAFAIKR